MYFGRVVENVDVDVDYWGRAGLTLHPVRLAFVSSPLAVSTDMAHPPRHRRIPSDPKSKPSSGLFSNVFSFVSREIESFVLNATAGPVSHIQSLRIASMLIAVSPGKPTCIYRARQELRKETRPRLGEKYERGRGEVQVEDSTPPRTGETLQTRTVPSKTTFQIIRFHQKIPSQPFGTNVYRRRRPR